MSTHILLVSAQAAPNLLPALDPAMKPDQAVLVVTGKMQDKADALETVLPEAGVKTQRIAVDDEHDFAHLEETLLAFAEQHQGQEVVLNLTGGTKLMALAAQSIAEAAGWRSFYVDVDTDEVIWLGKNAAQRQKLGEQLRLPHYLKAYGFALTAPAAVPQTSPQQQQLINTLLLQIGSLERPLSQLNWLAQVAEDKKVLEVRMDEQQRDSLSLATLLRNFEEAGVLRVAGDTIHFASIAALRFAKGAGWSTRVSNGLRPDARSEHPRQGRQPQGA